ncbi:MAG: hypothetical protein ACLP7P_02200 [Rhodomicrobium sp.]
MDTESIGAIRDAFLFDAHQQFQGLARWVPAPAMASVWEDGREAGLSVTRENHELICFTVAFDAGTGDEDAQDLKARLVVEQRGDVSEVLLLGWRKSLPEPRKGLDSRADYAEGEYAEATGAVVQRLRDKLADVFGSHAAVVPYGAKSRSLRQAIPLDATFEVVATTARALSQVPAREPSGTAANTTAQRQQEFDLSVLEKVLGGREGSRAVLRYVAAVEGNLRAGNLNENLVAALIEQGLRVHYAVLRAEITGGSVSTGIGVAIKKWSRPVALGVAGLVEFVEGIYGIGPLVGENYATAGLALVQSVLFGAGLSQVSKPGAEQKSWAALLGAWSIGLTLLVANNPELQRLAQTHVFQLEQPAREAVARLNRAKKREGRVEGDLAESRGNQKGALEVKGRGRTAVVKSAKEEVTEAIGRRNSADDEIANAERDLNTTLADDPSRKLALITLALLFGSVSIGSEVYVARYLGTAEKEHAEALEKSRDMAELKAMLAHVRDHPEAVAAEFFGVLKGLYADILQLRGMKAEEAQETAERHFGGGEAIKLASARFSGKRYKPPKAARSAGLGS